MHSKIISLWRKLDAENMALFNDIEKIDPALLNTRPTPEAWSVNHNVLHLMLAERNSLKYLEKKISFGEPIPKANYKSTLRWLALKLAFDVPMLKFKAPKAIATMPEILDYTDLKTQYALERSKFKHFLENLPEHLVEADLYKHPRAGKMTVLHMLDFFISHAKRHRNQIKRTIKNF